MMYDPPKTGDRIFVSDGCNLEDIHVLGVRPPRSPPHVTAFQDAAELLLDLHVTSDSRRDDLFLPIVYLYRHAIELRLKDVIWLGIRLKGIEKDKKVDRILGGHALAPLWDTAKVVILRYGKNGDDICGAEGMVNQLHKLDANGQTLRYAINKSRTQRHQYESLPEWVNKRHLRDRMKSMCDFLEACIDWLDELYNSDK